MSIRRNARLIIIAATLIAVASLTLADDYKAYKPEKRRQKLFEITHENGSISFAFFGDPQSQPVEASLSDIIHAENEIRIADGLSFQRDGLCFNDRTILYDEISDIRINANEKTTTIVFFVPTEALSTAASVRRGARISFDANIVIAEQEFVRGFIFSVTGDIEVYGEVNKDIVSLFGNIYVAPGSVSRGDIVTVSGKIDAARNASVYGEFHAPNMKRLGRGHFYNALGTDIAFSPQVNYNRVDGAYLGGALNLEDADSLLPTISAAIGYAFESKRLRYRIAVTQTLLREKPFAIGGAVYKRLATEDDWQIGKTENMAFVLLATEDFRDYYEVEGGEAYAAYKPWPSTRIKVGYSYEKSRWFDAQPNLWSLFGGNKRFQANFSTAPDIVRTAGIAELDGVANGALTIAFDYDNSERDDASAQSSWSIGSEMEWSHLDFSSDFDYRRYTVNLIRRQNLHPRAKLTLRGRFGGSDGRLPLHKRFFLGGLSTMRGYKHKEFIGTRYWLTNVEFWHKLFRKSEIAALLIWDAAQIADNAPLDSEAEIRHNLGLALEYGDFRLSLAKRLDSAAEGDPQFYVRFASPF